MPAPVARTRVGNSSGRHSGSQPKNNVVTKPCANTSGRNDGLSGRENKNIPVVSTTDPRLIAKYATRRPSRWAKWLPKKLPQIAPTAHHPCVAALYPACAVPPILSAHGIIHLL